MKFMKLTCQSIRSTNSVIGLTNVVFCHLGQCELQQFLLFGLCHFRKRGRWNPWATVHGVALSLWVVRNRLLSFQDVLTAICFVRGGVANILPSNASKTYQRDVAHVSIVPCIYPWCLKTLLAEHMGKRKWWTDNIRLFRITRHRTSWSLQIAHTSHMKVHRTSWDNSFVFGFSNMESSILREIPIIRSHDPPLCDAWGELKIHDILWLLR